MSSMHRKALTPALLLASIAPVASAATDVTIQTPPPATTAIPAQPNMYPPQPQSASYAASYGVSQALARWNSLRQTDSLPFSSYASFLLRYPGWPGETAMRKTAERAIDPNSSAPTDVIAYFRAFPALTTTGNARFAFALLALGRIDEARAAARDAWHGGTLPRADEDRMLGLFGGAFGQDDHDQRLAMLLDSGDTASALRILPLGSPMRRPIYDARIALQTNASDADAKFAFVGSAANGDAGLLKDRANWLRLSGQSLAARSLLAQPRTLFTRPADPEKWYETLLTMARAAAADRQWLTAYQIASQVDDAYPSGTDVSQRSAGERDDYTSLVWLAGTTALQKLGRPADAVSMFERYAHAARSFQTQTKGFYWAGVASAASGQAARSMAYFEQAARPDLFYGQLALERLGRPIPPPQPLPLLAGPDPLELTFARRDLVEATRLLGQLGQWQDQSLFVRTLSEQVSTDEERAFVGRLAMRLGRPDLGVWVGRNARNAGSSFYTLASYPQVAIPPAFSAYWPLSHAIIRQESSFDRGAISHAGAQGMMQLMTPTARELSGKMGLSYAAGRLTRDPDYNILLGTNYFAQLMDYWGGSAPLAVASYNAGTGNVRKWIEANGDPRLPGADMLKWIEDIPYTETRNYVQRVLENAVVYDLINPNRPSGLSENRLSFYLGKSSRPG
jgi:soluble lytic murein transglycosylase